MILNDLTIDIMDGILENPEDKQNLWKIFRANSEYATALQEFIYVIQHFSLNSENMYEVHLKMLYTNVYCYLHERITSAAELPTLKMTDDFSEYFYYYGKEEILVEACFQFAIFYLCREYAKISNYFLSNNQIPTEVKERLFYNKIPKIIIEHNKLFKKLLQIPQIEEHYTQTLAGKKCLQKCYRQ